MQVFTNYVWTCVYEQPSAEYAVDSLKTVIAQTMPIRYSHINKFKRL
jgi:hypothetical protein